MKDHLPNWRRQKLVTGIPNFDLDGLHYDGEKLECGLCGKMVIGLAHHIVMAHDITPDEYRAKFNLNRIQPLVTPQYSDSHIKCITRLENPNRGFKLRYIHQERVRSQGRAVISAAAKHRTYRNKPKIPNTPKRLAASKGNLAKANVSLISTEPCCYCGKLTTGRRSHGRICCPDCHKIRGRLWHRRHTLLTKMTGKSIEAKSTSELLKTRNLLDVSEPITMVNTDGESELDAKGSLDPRNS